MLWWNLAEHWAGSRYAPNPVSHCESNGMGEIGALPWVFFARSLLSSEPELIVCTSSLSESVITSCKCVENKRIYERNKKREEGVKRKHHMWSTSFHLLLYLYPSFYFGIWCSSGRGLAGQPWGHFTLPTFLWHRWRLPVLWSSSWHAQSILTILTLWKDKHRRRESELKCQKYT